MANLAQGTEGIKYALFEVYLDGTAKKVKYYLDDTNTVEVDVNVNSALSYNGRTIFSKETIKYGIKNLSPGTYAAVDGIEGEDTTNQIRPFFATCTEINIAPTYKGYPITAIAYGALQGTNYGGGDYNPPRNEDTDDKRRQRSRIKTISLPNSIMILDHLCLNAHNYLEKINMPPKILFLGFQILGASNLKEIHFKEIQNIDGSGSLKKISFLSTNNNNNIANTKVYVESYNGDKNLYGPAKANTLVSVGGTYAPVETITCINQNSTYNNVGIPDYMECRVQGNNRMSIAGRPTLNTKRVKEISFSAQATEINYLPLFGQYCTDLKKIYIEGMPKSKVEITSMFHSELNTDQEVYFSCSKAALMSSLQVNEQQLNNFLGGRQAYYDYIPEVENWDTDFIGVSFKGKHLLREYNMYRVSKSNRYDMHLNANLKLKTATEKTFEGTYFFGGNRDPLSFVLDLAFDNLTVKQFKEVRQLFSPTSMGELIFDEHPYKVYDVKVNGTPKINYVLFENEAQERLYKGEITVQLTAYYPFAHTPKDIKNGRDGRYLSYYYNSNLYPRIRQWKDVSGLIKTSEDYQLAYGANMGINRGEAPAPFVLSATSVRSGDTITVANNTIKVLENCVEFCWDSKTGLVTGSVNSVVRPIKFTGQSICTLPVCSDIPTNYICSSNTDSTLSIDYQFWYY